MMMMMMIMMMIIIIIITGATRTISKSLRQQPSNIAEKPKIKELHKTTILGTANILQKVLM
jgi:heme/copper-type cytochrome/quinol oxidase subunit 2